MNSFEKQLGGFEQISKLEKGNKLIDEVIDRLDPEKVKEMLKNNADNEK